MSQHNQPPSPARSNHAEDNDTLIENDSSQSITTTSPADAAADIDVDLAETRATEAAHLINRLPSHFTSYEWLALRVEVVSYSTSEWESMDLAWKKSMIREVIQDAKKMELIRETLFSMHIRVSRVDEIMGRVAEAANERICREGVEWREGRGRTESEDTAGEADP